MALFGNQITTVPTSSTASPWGPQQQYLQDLWAQASGLQRTAPTVPPFAPETTEARGGSADRARMGSPVMGAAGDHLAGLLSGQFLNSNPYLDQMFDAASRSITDAYSKAIEPGITSRMELAGRFGSPAHESGIGTAQDRLVRGLSDLGANIYGQNYAQERAAMDRGMLFAPSMAAAEYSDLDRLLSVGGLREAQLGRELQDPWDRLTRYGGLISGNYGGTTTAQDTYFSNPASQTLGLALGGASLGKELGIGSGLGAGLGGLLSLF